MENPVISLDILNKEFDSAAQRAAKLEVPNQSRLDLYGLYKQATVGDCTSSKPSRLKVIEHSKWDAWHKLNGMTEAAAKHAYTELVRKLDPTFESEASEGEQTESEEVLSKTINIVVEENHKSQPTRVVIQEEKQNDCSPPITVASVDVSPDEAPINIAIQSASSGAAIITSRFPTLQLLGNTTHDSPLPTWGVFLLGVLFLCFLDDNVSLSNMIMNGLGITVLTAALISLQIK